MVQHTKNTQSVRIGSSDLEVAPLALGGNVFGWTADPKQSHEVLDEFLAAGGNCIDTADGYSHWAPGNSGGESETVLGAWITSRGNRDDVTLATKVSTHPGFLGLAGDNVRRAVDASLERLKTDRIDLYYAHFDDADTPLEETVVAFSELVDAGKIRAIGLSNYTAERVAEWCGIARDGGYHLPVALQPLYSLVERDFETNGLQQVAATENLSVLPYYSLAKGFLTGKYREAGDVEASDASLRAGGAAEYLNDRGRAVLKALDGIAEEHSETHDAEVSVAAVALAWLRQQPTVAAPIASARTVDQVAPLIQSMSIDLTPAERKALADASGDA